LQITHLEEKGKTPFSSISIRVPGSIPETKKRRGDQLLINGTGMWE
jgi:hypothetical protein